jgi:hypothetical protein
MSMTKKNPLLDGVFAGLYGSSSTAIRRSLPVITTVGLTTCVSGTPWLRACRK